MYFTKFLGVGNIGILNEKHRCKLCPWLLMGDRTLSLTPGICIASVIYWLTGIQDKRLKEGTRVLWLYTLKGAVWLGRGKGKDMGQLPWGIAIQLRQRSSVGQQHRSNISEKSPGIITNTQLLQTYKKAKSTWKAQNQA